MLPGPFSAGDLQAAVPQEVEPLEFTAMFIAVLRIDVLFWVNIHMKKFIAAFQRAGKLQVRFIMEMMREHLVFYRGMFRFWADPLPVVRVRVEVTILLYGPPEEFPAAVHVLTVFELQLLNGFISWQLHRVLLFLLFTKLINIININRAAACVNSFCRNKN